MTGTSATLASNTDCIMVQEVEAFTVSANGQTAFTLAFIPSGDVVMQVNGSGRMHSITAVGVNATYTPAINGGYVLQTGDEVEVAYARMVCVGDPPAAEVCPGPMTRLELIALRNAGGLSKDCDYVVTDHVQGRLVAGTTIHLQAVSATQLSENASVQTTYDNEAWAGIYDIDLALVLELTDNRGNRAKGINGLEVANFDWGNTAYTNVTVDSATLTVTTGNAALITNVVVRMAASLNLTGFLGSMSSMVFERASVSNFTNANGAWRLGLITDNSTFNASGYTGGGDNYYFEVREQSTVLINNRTSPVILRNATLYQATVNAANISTGTLSIQNSPMLSQVTINQTFGAGATTLLRVFTKGNCVITNTVGGGTLSLDAVEMGWNAIARKTNAGALNIAGSLIDGGSNIYNDGTGNMNVTRVEVREASNVYLETGCTINGTYSNSKVEGSSNIRSVGAIVAGSITVSSTHLRANGAIFQRAAYSGVVNIALSTITGSSTIDFTSGNRSYTITRIDMNEASRVLLSGTGAVTDTITDLFLFTRGTLIISCTGAANALNYNQICGLSGTLTLSGTTGAQVLDRCKLSDGVVTIHNCPLNQGLAMCTTRDFGRILMQDVPVAKNVQYCDVSVRGSITVIAATGGGTLSYVNVTGFGTFAQTGVAAGAQRVTVMAGAVNHDGGSIDTLFKAGMGNLTTGNFVHNNVVYMSNVNTTLTAANVNRALYQGLAAGAYAVGGQVI